MSELAIKVENLGKRYTIGLTRREMRYRTLRDRLAALVNPGQWFGRNGHDAEAATLWALRGVSFEVRVGDVLGIIGRNGAGKSTLLKVLARITEPTEGQALTIGRVGSLLEVGTGFHPELTGRENVFLNGAILGMPRTEIQRKFDEIVDFSGIDKFIDTPVKRYSSGMYVRLAFAVAAHLEPDILVVDEVLAVGDAAFQEKCINKMSEVAKSGRTVLFVSHNLNAVSTLCPQSLYLEGGRVVLEGESQAVIDHYLRAVRAAMEQPLRERTDRKGGGQLRFTGVTLADSDGQPIDTAQCGQAVRFILEYEAGPEAILDDEMEFRIKVEGTQQERLFYLSSRLGGHTWEHLAQQGRVECLIPELPLAPGRYMFHLVGHRGSDVYDDVAFAGNFTVVWGDYFGTGRLPRGKWGRALVRHAWRLSDY